MKNGCSEYNNMKITKDYFKFITQIYEDFIKYILRYKNITNDYIKNLTQFYDKYSFKLLRNNDQNNTEKLEININHIYKILESVPKIIKKQIINLREIITGIETTSSNFENIIKEKNILAANIQRPFEEYKDDLHKRYSAIDDKKEEYLNNIEKIEEMMNKFYSKNDGNANLPEQIKNSIKNTKKIEENYKNLIKYSKSYEDTFFGLANSSTYNMKKLVCETSNIMKDAITDFIIVLKNYLKMQLSEIDIYLPELSELNESEELEKIIDEGFNKSKNLEPVKATKYKLKILNFNPDSELDNNNIINIEDGFEEMQVINNSSILPTIKKMKENFDLIEDPKINIKVEEEKGKCRNLSDKILSNKKIIPEDVNELNKLLDIHHNRVVFLQKLNEYRIKGKFEISKDIYNTLTTLFNTILNTIERDDDIHSAKNVIILSQTYYIMTENGKRYLQKEIQENKLFKNKKFWEDLIEFSIKKEICNSINLGAKNGTLLSENKKEVDERYGNIVFAQILPVADNMIEFGVDEQTMQEIIFPKIEKYKINPALAESIKAVMNGKK